MVTDPSHCTIHRFELMGHVQQPNRLDSLAEGESIVARVNDEGSSRLEVATCGVESTVDLSGKTAFDLDRPQRSIAVFDQEIDFGTRVRPVEERLRAPWQDSKQCLITNPSQLIPATGCPARFSGSAMPRSA